MQLIHYTDESSFSAALAPHVAADPDANPRLLIEAPQQAAGLKVSDTGKSVFLRQTTDNRWLPSGRDAHKAVELVKALAAHAPPRLFAEGYVADALRNYWQQTPTFTLKMNWYRLHELIQPKAPAGHARLGTIQDLPIIMDFIAAFDEEAIGIIRPPELLKPDLEKWLSSQTFLVWEQTGSLAACLMMIPNGSGLRRIGGVFTPIPLRGQGIGKALVAAACQYAASQQESAALHADIKHEYTNQMYTALGFKLRGQHTEYRFTA